MIDQAGAMKKTLRGKRPRPSAVGFFQPVGGRRRGSTARDFGAQRRGHVDLHRLRESLSWSRLRADDGA